MTSGELICTHRLLSSHRFHLYAYWSTTLEQVSLVVCTMSEFVSMTKLVWQNYQVTLISDSFFQHFVFCSTLLRDFERKLAMVYTKKPFVGGEWTIIWCTDVLHISIWMTLFSKSIQSALNLHFPYFGKEKIYDSLENHFHQGVTKDYESALEHAYSLFFWFKHFKMVEVFTRRWTYNTFHRVLNYANRHIF